MHPFRALGSAISELVKGDDRIGSDQSVLARSIMFLTLPFRLLFGFMVFMVQAWASSRPGFAFIGALPMIIVSLLFFSALLAADFFYSEAKLVGGNLGYYGYHAAENGDVTPEWSHMFAEKLVTLSPESNQFKLLLGESFDRMEEPVKAFDVVSSMASFDNTGVAGAHIWLAEYYLRNPHAKTIHADSDREVLASKHLTFAVEQEPENGKAHMNLVNIYLSKCRQFEKKSPKFIENAELAIKHLSALADAGQLQVIPKLAELNIEMGNLELAKRYLEKTVIRLHPFARRQPENFQIWLTMVQCAILAENFDEALELVKEGMQMTSDRSSKQKLQQLASMIFLKRSGDFTDMSNPSQYRMRLEALGQAIQINPADKTLYLKLLDFIGDKKLAQEKTLATDKLNQAVANTVGDRLDFSAADEDWLRDAITDSKVTGVVHSLLGMKDVSQGNVSDGAKHWRIAEQQNSRTQIIINNLIDVAAKDRANEFANMRDMITLAIELFPDQPIFYQTRGVFHKNQSRIDEAIKDLLYASEKMPAMIVLHRHLADCYKLQGDQAKVDEQEGLLHQKLNQLNDADRKLIEASIQ